MAYEDWTTWTEVDTNGDLTVAANTITIDSCRQDADGVVWKDYGVDHFGNFSNIEIDGDVNTGVSETNSTYTFIGMSNNTSYLNWRDMWLNEEGWVVQRYMHASTANSSKIALRACDGLDSDDTVYSTTHRHVYLDCHRNGAVLTIDIYDDALRTVLYDTLTVTDPGVNYRYCMCGSAYHCVGCGNADKEITGWVYNLDLHEVVGDTGTGVMMWDGSANVELARDDSSPVQMYDGSQIVGIKLVAPNHADATPIHVFDGTTIKALKKKV